MANERNIMAWEWNGTISKTPVLLNQITFHIREGSEQGNLLLITNANLELVQYKRLQDQLTIKYPIFISQIDKNSLTREGSFRVVFDSSEARCCSRGFPYSSDSFSISLRTISHLLSNWTLSGPLNETAASSSLFTVCLTLLKFRAPCKFMQLEISR